MNNADLIIFQCHCWECQLLDEANRLEDALLDWRVSLIARKHIITDTEALLAKDEHTAIVRKFLIEGGSH